MAKVIEFSLDASSVENAIREMKKTIDDVKKAINELVRELTERGMQIAMVELAASTPPAVRTGELSDSIIGVYDDQTHVGTIRADAPYAFFVEYGTGIVGAESPQHPESGGDWAPPAISVGGYGPYTGHDTNGHGEDGWYYISGRDGKLHWTKGMPARPFMYETYKELIAIAQSVFAEVFSRLE